MFTTDEIRNASSKVKAVDMLKANLRESDKWATRALIAIYNQQTADEQDSQETSHDNGVGFNGLDANILSSFAEQVQSGRILSARQMEILRKCIMKYSGQLLKIGNLR